jgi:site-specific DNA-methyltransferase (adenine-specific)
MGESSRYFYTAKADRAEREKGIEGERLPGGSNAKGYTADVARGIDRNRPTRNHHPTVKPVDLMRWLVRLVCPPGGVVLDPYTGSGTTGVACRLEGFGFIGIELNPEYIELARQRIAAETPSLFTEAI